MRPSLGAIVLPTPAEYVPNTQRVQGVGGLARGSGSGRRNLVQKSSDKTTSDPFGKVCRGKLGMFALCHQLVKADVRDDRQLFSNYVGAI